MYYYYNSQYGKLTISEYQQYAQYGLSAEPYFDGDNQLACAVEYVTAETLPTLYTLTGHGEQELTQMLSSYIDLSGFPTSQLLRATRYPRPAPAYSFMHPSSTFPTGSLKSSTPMQKTAATSS